MKPKFVCMAANGFERQFKILLRDMEFKYSIMHGVYKGIPETSFKIEVSGQHFGMGMLRSLAKAYKQESILIVDESNEATLYFIETKASVRLGVWQTVDKSIAVQSEAYSFEPNTNLYYLAS